MRVQINTELISSAYINLVLLNGKRLEEIPLYFLRNCRYCRGLYITAFRVNRSTTRERYLRDLEFLDSEIAFAQRRKNSCLFTVLTEVKQCVSWGLEVFD